MNKSIREWQRLVYKNAYEHGWWEDAKTGKPIPPITRIPETIALMHSEASEALEEYRADRMDLWHSPSEIGPKPEGFGIELADLVIRAMDTAEALGIDLEEMIRLKHEFNLKRPYRHGGKKA